MIKNYSNMFIFFQIVTNLQQPSEVQETSLLLTSETRAILQLEM
mgnify:CR=1 FL=1